MIKLHTSRSSHERRGVQRPNYGESITVFQIRIELGYFNRSISGEMRSYLHPDPASEMFDKMSHEKEKKIANPKL